MPHSQKTQNINQSNIVTNSIKDKQNKTKTHTHSENKIGGSEDTASQGVTVPTLTLGTGHPQQDIGCLSKQEGLSQLLTV